MAFHEELLIRQEKSVREFQAAEFFRKGMNTLTTNPTAALEALSIAISLRSDLSRYFVARATVFRNLNDYDAAIQDYTHAISIDPKAAAVFSSRSSCHKKMGNIVQALIDLTHAIDVDGTKSGVYYLNRASLLMEERYWPEAIVDLNHAVAESKETSFKIHFRALCARGKTRAKMDQVPSAIKDFQEAILCDGDSPIGYNHLGLLLYSKKEYLQASSLFTEALKCIPDEAMYYHHRGMAFLGMDEYSKAVFDFEMAITINDKESAYYYHRGQARLLLVMENNQSEEREDVVNQTVNNSEAVPSHQEILRDFRHAIELSPNVVVYQYTLGLYYEIQLDYLHAQECFTLSLEMDKTHIDSYYHLGLVLHLQKKEDAAIMNFQTALSLKVQNNDKEDEDAELLSCMYESLALSTQFSRSSLSLKSIDAAIEQTPSRSFPYYFKGETLLKTKKAAAAIPCFTTAIELHDVDRSYPHWYAARAIAYQNTDHAKEAIDDFTTALTLPSHQYTHKQSHPSFRINRGICYFLQHEYKLAQKDLSIALNETLDSPHVGKILYFYGLVALFLEEYVKCITFLQKAVECEECLPVVADSYFHIGIAFARREMYEKASTAFTQAISTCNDKTRRTLYVHERAKSYQMHTQYAKALVDFTTVAMCNPNNAHAYFGRAFVYKSLGKLKAAAADFERAKRLDPKNITLVVNYKQLHDTECIILCRPGEEPKY